MCEENSNVYNCVPPVRLITASKRSLRQGNVFTCVCHYVHMGVGFPACITDHLTRGSAYRGSASRGVGHPGGLHLGGWGDSCTPSPRYMGYYKIRQQSRGTHPTEMHSCCKSRLLEFFHLIGAVNKFIQFSIPTKAMRHKLESIQR